MYAKITIFDDNNIPKGVYELKPSEIFDGNIIKTYLFEFEFTELKITSYKIKSEDNN